MFISDTSIKQPVFITMIMLLAVTLGLLAFNTMPVNLLPDIDVPVAVVTVPYPGAGPDSVADQVAQPLEDELSTLNGVSRITSTSSEGVASVIVEFEQEVDPVVGLQDVRERVNLIRPRLPADIEDPTFLRFDPNQSPILTVAFRSQSGQSGQELRQLIDDEILPRVQQVTGVGSTELGGGQVRQINVNLDLRRLQAYRILPSQVSDAIENANVNRGLGDINVNGTDVNLRSPSVIDDPAKILEIGIPGTPYKVRDVAVVEDGVQEPDQFSRLNGEDAVTLDVRKQSGANTVAVGEGAKEALDEAVAEFPDLEYVIVRDDAEEVNANVTGAIEEIFFAVLFALVVVMYFFSGLRVTLLSSAIPAAIVIAGLTLGYGYINPLLVLGVAAILLLVTAFFTSRNTAVTILGLPIIIIATFAAISAFGLTINILTLLALSVSVGLVIDDAIVVRENVFRWMERGLSPKEAASKGTAQVSLSVIAMTLTIIAVFVPAAFTTGVTGIIFFSFAITVACAMALSLVEAFTLAPMVSAYFFKQKQPAASHAHAANQPVEASQEDMPLEAHEELGAMERFYERVLNWSLRRRLVVVALTLVVLVASVAPLALGLVKFGFFPDQDQRQFGVGFELPPGTPLETTDALAREAEAILQAEPGVEAVITTVGASGGDFGGGGGSERAEFLVKLDRYTATLDAQEALRPKMPADRFPQIAFALPSFNGASVDVTNRPIQARILSSRPLDEIAPAVDELVASVQDVPNLVDLDTTYTPGAPELQVRLDPARANDIGISNNDIARTLRALVDGDTAAVYREQGNDYDIVVRLRRDDRQNVDELRNLRIPIQGQLVPLASVASLELASSPTTIRRADRQTEVIIGGNNVGRTTGEIQADMQERFDAVQLPPGTRVVFGGQSEDQAEGFASLAIAMLLSVLFVYMVLASQFASFTQPFVIMLAMPLCFIGGFLGLTLTGVTLTIFGMIGFVMLLGLATKNSILLVDFTNQLYRSGMEKNLAIARASAVRLRPILMTSATIIFGAVPAAVGFGEGAGTRRALAVVLIGGMITATILTLVVVPVAYSLLESIQRRLGNLVQRLRGRSRRAAPAPAMGIVDGVVPSSVEQAPRPVAVPAHGNGSYEPATNGYGNGHANGHSDGSGNANGHSDGNGNGVVDEAAARSQDKRNT
jgi:hydrophobic/amphiphilic exporter-1 (mainly G- bacteria), HAE1 family